MASTRDTFAAYLRAAMGRAGLPTAPDVEDATGGAVKRGTIYRWLRGDGYGDEGEVSPRLVRAAAKALGVPPLEMFVAAGLLSAEEAGLEGEPEPPRVRTIEDDIREDRRLTPERQELLIQLLETLTEEHTGRTSVRTRRPRTSPDQGIDTDDNEELSG
jgi:hypothetical protein